jgi:hypothetical protein
MAIWKALEKIAPLAISAVGSIAGAKKGAKADKYQQQALDYARQRDAGLEPVRQRALQMALAQRPQRPDLSAMFADPGNPYARAAGQPDFGGPPAPAAPPPIGPIARPMGGPGGPMGPVRRPGEEFYS